MLLTSSMRTPKIIREKRSNALMPFQQSLQFLADFQSNKADAYVSLVLVVLVDTICQWITAWTH